MSMWLRQSTAGQEVLLGPFVDSTDGVTAETALTIANTDIKIWVEGATSETNKNSGGATHIASGRYYCVLDATDTATLGKLEINVVMAGALPVRREYMVVPANVFDSIVLGTDALQIDAVQISGDSTAADNLEAACDGTGYNVGGGAVVAASVTGAVGSVTGNVGGNVAGSVASVTAGVTVANGAITAAAIADGAIDAATFAADVDAEARSWLGLASANLDTQLGDIPTNTELAAAFTEIKGATWSSTDTLEAIRDRGDAAWVTATSVTVSDKTGFSLAADQSGVTIGTVTTNTDMRGTDNAMLATEDGSSFSAIPDMATATNQATIAGYIDTEVGAIQSSINALNDVSVADILTTQMTESYASDGAAPTLAQALLLIQQVLTDVSISGTTMTIRKLDGSTTAATLTLNDGTTPTAATRAT